MIKAVINTKKYFQAPGNYFWRWAENGEVIEWMNGSTICYRDDLLAILKQLAGDGVPPLAPLLMVLLACKERMHLQHKFFLLRNFRNLPAETLEDAVKFFENISELPEKSKTGRNRIHLLYEVFDKEDFIFSNLMLREAIDELSSGQLDKVILEEGDEITEEQRLAHLLCFSKALKKFPTVQSLELKLNTGLERIPEPTEIVIPESSPTDLFDRLAEDPKTIGIARLANRLIAALNIPMHSQGSSDLPLGGISDITNRGNYDKLLLSELAHDTDLLMARLVNNEALYFRREEPPENPKRQRTILIDTTLKMWGTPRVFAISAALACAYHSKHGELIESYTLSGEEYHDVNLDTKEGIITALEKLHHSLHCGRALQKIIHDFPASALNEYFFITDEQLLRSEDFHGSLSQVRDSLSFILTVDRSGELNFYECIAGRLKLLSTTRFDLEKLLFAPPKILNSGSKPNDEKPAFLLQLHQPLLFPWSRIKQSEEKLFHITDIGFIAISETQRLLFMPKHDTGAYELLSFIEKGIYAVGFGGSNEIYVMVSNPQRNFCKFYKIDIHTLEKKPGSNF